ncbi:unnamed protein product [Penicillium salamii]|nr:unnamed protein product [Penicillium salamii]CAG8408412.1 unnamed protein product [Penicillium salamii]
MPESHPDQELLSSSQEPRGAWFDHVDEPGEAQEGTFLETPKPEEVLLPHGYEKIDSFPGVVLDASSSQLGVWNDAPESVRLRIELSTKYVEPRIDIGLTIKWHDGRISHAACPATPFFRIFHDQIESMELLQIVDSGNNSQNEATECVEQSLVKEPIHPANTSTETPKDQLRSPQALFESVPNSHIELFSELREMEHTTLGKGVDDLISENRLWLLCINLKVDSAPRFGPGLFNKVRTYGNQTSTVHKLRDLFYQQSNFYFVLRGTGLRAADRWVSEIIEPLGAAPIDTTTVIVHRPKIETPGVRQPTILEAFDASKFEPVTVQVPIRQGGLSRFLGCNEDLQHSSNSEIRHELMGGDMMDLPYVDLLEGVDKRLIEMVISQGRVNLDVKAIVDELSNLHGRFFTVTGAAGSGKTYTMYTFSANSDGLQDNVPGLPPWRHK